MDLNKVMKNNLGNWNSLLIRVQFVMVLEDMDQERVKEVVLNLPDAAML